MRNQLLLAAALGLGLCASGVASAQERFGQPAPAPYPVPGAQGFESSRDALIGQAKKSVDSANANIDALKNMASSQTGAPKQQSEDMAHSLAASRDTVQNDIVKMGKANLNDWGGLQPVVTKNMAALTDQLKKASALTHLPVPGM
jgi:hypothetical protein